MHHDYWHKRWQDNNTKFNQQNPHPLLTKHFHTLNLAPKRRILVPLCGKSIDMVWLAAQGHHVIGVELSDIACEAFFNENNLPFNKSSIDTFTVYESEQYTLFAGDFFKLTKIVLGKIDAVYDRAATIALPDEMRAQYAQAFTNLLDPQTQMLLITFVYAQSTMQGPPFCVDDKNVQQLYGKHFSIEWIDQQPLVAIPPHLANKGLQQAEELVFQLTSIK